MVNYILVHGAWHGGWCWHKVVEELTQKGHKVEAPSLPAHNGGIKAILPWLVSLDDYVDSIIRLIDSNSEPVILVGHSMGGIVITQVAERCPEKIKKLVYVCAFVPPSGKSLGDLAPEVSPIQPADQKVNLLRGGVAMKPDRTQDIFYNKCVDADVKFANSRLCLQPIRPFSTAVKWTTEKFGSVAKMAVRCDFDGAITPEGQEKMARDSNIEEIVPLDSDHSPFFCKPKELAEILLKASA